MARRRKSSNGHVPLTTLTIADMSDRDLMFAVDKVSDPDGLIHPADVADELRIASNGKRTPAGTVSMRLAWMRTHDPDCNPEDCYRHLGYLERIDPLSLGLKRKDGVRYVITDKGRRLMAGRINATMQKAFSSAESGQAALMLAEVMARAHHHGDFREIGRQYNHTRAKLTGKR